ncbi:unnamed protein product [Rotaria sp. Silwood1]|nr:unnamed protein product [Rotaria sp. Silwood1]CAF1540194.1 unnamed protein product [Rotaria sp. Silwood1]CAF1565425.1 unnamed protein product [Rotaria sp. Silwood1]CAF3684639.1 unnamed protein product [Rotaria sp. Silwood1]CAF3748157.1 unnamed protein product [Rotaria sp. Silwood1]
MSNSTSSNINATIRTRRSNKQYRRRNELSYLMSHPTFTNFVVYFKYFFFKSNFGSLALIFMFLGIFHIYIFCHIVWPKIIHWLHNSTATESNEF